MGVQRDYRPLHRGMEFHFFYSIGSSGLETVVRRNNLSIQ
jgi:hypothetical protein